ncbi:MAG: ABC transporter permease, partial [Actinobacteria bacterium]
LGIPIGIISALKRRTLADRAAMGFALFGVSAPVFWIGLIALVIFWHYLHISSGTGYVPITQSPVSWFGHFWLAWVVLALLYAGFYARMVRGNMLEVMSEDYIRTARAKGLSERRVIAKHGLRAALTPVVTMLGLDLGALMGGAIGSGAVRHRRHPSIGHPCRDRGDHLRRLCHCLCELRRRHNLRVPGSTHPVCVIM